MAQSVFDVIQAPIITEKSMNLKENYNKYTFKVSPDASKIQIKEAVRKLFNVKVVDCTTINVQGKVKRLRGRPGRTSSYKKAIVKLAEGDKIDAFEI